MQRRFRALRPFALRHVVSPQFAVRLFGAGVVAVLAGTFAFSQGALARNSDVYALGDDFYKSIHERNFALRSEPNEITSSQQLRDMIYNRFGSMVLEQTTGSVRRYGQQFFGDGFRMRSNIGWDVTEGFRGDLELGVPLLPKSLAGHNFALQFQPGLVLWTGHREQERLDVNLGLVARYRVGRDSPFAFGMPSLIYGANIFYDINTDNSLDRLGVGVDMQARRLMLAVNAYIALDDDWQEGDDGYQERAVSGFEFRAHYDFLTNAQLRASIGGWENTDVNATGSDFDDYSFGATVGGDWYFHPNFAVSGDYEYESYGLGDSRFTIGVEARWPGKRLGNNRGTRAMDLYALVEREQRILYAERRTSVVVTAGMIGQSDIVETDGATNADVEFTLELSRALAAAGAAAGGNTAEFDVYTSVAEDDIGAGNTAAGASDYVAIGDPQASGEQTSPAAPVAAADTCAAATPGDATNPCRLRIVPGTTEGTLTITGLVLGDDLEEEAEYFAVKFKPTAATRARFGLPADFATAVVRILPSDPTRTIEMTFQETVALAPATSGGTSPLPVRVTLSKPLAAPVTIDVVLTAQVVVTTQQSPSGQQVRTVQTTRTVERTCRIPVTLESGEEVLVKTVDVSQCFATNQFDITEGEFADATVTLELPPKKLPPRDDDDDEGEGEEDRESAGEVFDLDGDNKVNGVPLAKEGDAGAGEKQKLKPTGAKVAQAKVALARPAANKRRVAIAVQYADGETSFAEPNSDGTENFRLTLSGTGAVPTGTRVRYEIVHIDTVAADVAVARARTAASQAGASFIALPVTIKDDDLAEDAEAFGIKVTEVSEGGSGETIDQTLFTGGSAPGYTATALIAANDRRMVSLASTTLAATETDADIEIDLTARLSGALADDLVLSLTATPGTAIAADYTVPTSLTIDAGDTSSAAKITIKGDELAEGTETFTIAVRYPSRLPDGLDDTATPNGLIETVTVTITDDDEPAKLVLYEQVGATAGDTDDKRLGDTASVAEAGNAGDNGKKLYYRLETGADDIATASAALSIALASGSVSVSDPVTVATEPAHFAITPKALTIAQGASISTVFTLTTVDDNGSGADTGPNKNDRQFGLTPSVSDAPGWLATPTASTITITDDDGKARLRIAATATTQSNIVTSGVATAKAIAGNTNSDTDSTDYALSVTEGVGAITLTFSLSRLFDSADSIDGITIAPGALVGAESTAARADFASRTAGVPTAAVTVDNTAGDTATLVYTVNDDNVIERDELAVFPLTIAKKASSSGDLDEDNFGTAETINLKITILANDAVQMDFSLFDRANQNLAAGYVLNGETTNSSPRMQIFLPATSVRPGNIPLTVSVLEGTAKQGAGKDYTFAPTRGGLVTIDAADVNTSIDLIAADTSPITILDDTEAEAAESFTIRTQIGDTATSGVTLTNIATLANTASALRAARVDQHLAYYGFRGPIREKLDISSNTNIGASNSGSKLLIAGGQLIYERTITIPANDTIAKVGLFDANPRGTGAQTPLTELTLEEAADATDLWVALLDADNKLVRASANVSVAVTSTTVTGGARGEGQLTIATSPVSIPAAAGKAKFTIAAAADSPGNEVDGAATLTATAGAIPAGEEVADSAAVASVAVAVNDKEGKPRITLSAASSVNASQIVSGGTATIGTAKHTITVKEGAGTLTLTLGLSKAFRSGDNITSVTVTPGSLEDDSEISEDDFENDGITSTAVTLKGDATDTGTLVYKIKNDDIAEDTETAKFELAITKAGAGTLSTSNFGTPTTVELNIIVQANDLAKLTFALGAALAEGSEARPTVTSDNVIATNASPSSARNPIIYGANIALQRTTPAASAADVTGADATDRDVGIKTAISNATFAATSGTRSLNLALLVVEDDTLAEGAETFLYRVPVGVPLRAADYANAASLMQYNGLDTDVSEHKFTVADTAQAGALAFKRVESGSNAQLWAEITMTIPANDTISRVALFNSDPGAAGTAITSFDDALTVEEAGDSDVWVAMVGGVDDKIVTSAQDVEIAVASVFTATGTEGAVTLTGVTAGKITIMSGGASAKFSVAAAADTGGGNERDNIGKLTADISTTLTAGTAAPNPFEDEMPVTVSDKEGKPRITIEAAAGGGAGTLVSGGTKTGITGNTNSGTDSADYELTVTEGAGAITLTFGLSKVFGDDADIDGITISSGTIRSATQLSTEAADTAVRADFASSAGVPSAAATVDNTDGDTATLIYTVNDDAIIESDELAVFPLTITKKDGSGGTLTAGNFATPETINLKITILANDSSQLRFNVLDTEVEALAGGYVLTGETAVKSPEMTIKSRAGTAAPRPRAMPVTVSVVAGTAEQGAAKDYTFTQTNSGEVSFPATGSGLFISSNTFSRNAITIVEEEFAEPAETFTIRTQIGDSSASGVTLTNAASLTNTVAALRTAKVEQHLAYYGFTGPIEESRDDRNYSDIGIENSGSKLLIAGGQLFYERTITIPKSDSIAGLRLVDEDGDEVTAPAVSEDVAAGKKYRYRLVDGEGNVVEASENINVVITFDNTVTLPGNATRAAETTDFTISQKTFNLVAGQNETPPFTIAPSAALVAEDNPPGAETVEAKNDRLIGLVATATAATTVAAPNNMFASGTSARGTHTLTLVDDDGRVRIEVQAGKLINSGNAAQSTLDLGEVAEGATLTMSFKLTRQVKGTGSPTGIKFKLAIAADPNDDLGDLGGAGLGAGGVVTLTNAANAGASGTAKVVTVAITDDDIAEGDDTFTINVTEIAGTAASGTPTLSNFGSGTSTGTASIKFTVPANDLATLTFSIASALAEPATTGGETAVNLRMESSAELGADMAFASQGVDGSGDDVDSSTATGSFDGAGANNGRTNIGAVTVQADNLAEGDETFVFESRLGALIPTNTLGAAFTSANAAGKAEILLKRLGLGPANTHLYKVGSAAASAAAVTLSSQTSGRNTFLFAEITMTIPANDTIAKLLLFNSDPGSAGDTVTDLTDTLTVEEAADSDVWVAMLDSSNKIVTSAQDVDIGVALSGFTTSGTEGAVTLTGVTAGKATITSGNASATFKVAAAADTGGGNEADNSGTLTASVSTTLGGAAITSVPDDTMAVTVNDKQGKRRLRMQAGATRGADIVSGGADTEIKGNTSSATDSVDYALSVTEGVGAITFTFTLPKAFSDSQDIGGLTITPGAIRTATQLSTAAADTAVAADFASSGGIPSTAVTIANTDGATATLVFTVNNDNVIEADELAVFPLAITKSSGDGALDETNFAAPETINLKITILANDSVQLQFDIFDRDDEDLGAGYVLGGEAASESPHMFVDTNREAARPRAVPLTVSVMDGTAELGAGKDYTFAASGAFNFSAQDGDDLIASHRNRNTLTILDDKVAENAETFKIRVQLGDTAASGVTLSNTATLANTASALGTARAAQHLAYYGLTGPIKESRDFGSTFTDVGAENSGSKLLVATVSGRSQLFYERTITIPKNDPISGFALVASDATGTALPSVTLDEGTASTAKYKIAVKDANLLVAADTTVTLALAQASGQDVFICSANTPLACTSPANKVTSVTIAAGARVSTEEFYLIAQQDTTAGDATLELKASTAATDSNFASSAKTAAKIADIKVTDDEFLYNVEVKIPALISVSGTAETKVLPVKTYDSVDELAVTVKESSGAAANMTVKLINLPGGDGNVSFTMRASLNKIGTTRHCGAGTTTADGDDATAADSTSLVSRSSSTTASAMSVSIKPETSPPDTGDEIFYVCPSQFFNPGGRFDQSRSDSATRVPVHFRIKVTIQDR